MRRAGPGEGGRPDIAIVGGGVIGLAIAWRAAAAGLGRVVVYDPELANSAPAQCSWAAAGMLAPVTEVHYGEEALLRLTLAARDRWAEFAGEVAAAGGVDPGYRTEGTISVARDGDDLARFEEISVFQSKLGLEVTRLRSREARALEPALSPRVRGAFVVTGDHSVDNRALVHALRAACLATGVDLRPEPVRELAALDTGTVILAAGAASARLLPELGVRPVKGQLLHLRGEPLLTRTIRGVDAYLVPRGDGRLIVGATVEEKGADVTATAGGVYELLRAAYELVPGVTELAFTEVVVGLRPATADNAPVIGRWDERLFVATGHYRNGILLAPVTADLVVDILSSSRVPDLAVPFSPDRFR
ncbi:MAG TPA: glycine oxidase ThiO [Frankiaceae bacterium]|nr:glycine oxidase ThiO [Frankiaceae bacterium]